MSYAKFKVPIWLVTVSILLLFMYLYIEPFQTVYLLILMFAVLLPLGLVFGVDGSIAEQITVWISWIALLIPAILGIFIFLLSAKSV